MTKLFIEVKKSNRKNKPIDIDIQLIGQTGNIKEALIYAFMALVEEEKERENKRIKFLA